jgi:pyruvate ferredoxin oxidoreductase delta subunit
MRLNPGAVVRDPGSSKKNKTGSWRTFRPKVTGRCVACKICEWYCPDSAIRVKETDGRKKATIDYDYCKGCLICIGVCPQKAIEAEKER